MRDQSHDGTRPIRVAMPMLNLVRGGMGGTETYARELTRELSRRPEIEFQSAVTSSAAGFTNGPEHLSRRLAGGESNLARLTTQVRATADPSLRRWVRGADVVHYPFTVPVPPAPRHLPVVQTLHDVQHLDLPALFSRAERLYRRVTYNRSSRRADVVITDSDFSRQQIISHLGIDGERIRVAHLGVDTAQFTPYLGRREDFVLYPARGWAHKNHRVLIEAMHLVREQVPELRLVLTGGALDIDDLPAWVDNRGLVSRAELVDLFRRASCLAFPSRYEGFGLPPLEAMASGCPVAAARAGSLPEICGDAAVLFDPDDPRAVADAILQARRDAATLVPRGLEQIRRFTWAACADVHVQVFCELTAHSAAPRP
jgi:glycosyltransferase involved in cell wall biosynthesis